MMTSPLPAADDPDEDGLDKLFHALAHRTRRALLARLAQGPAMVTELAAPFAMSLPSVSKHLRVLERAGLIVRTVDGRVHRCTFNPAPLADAADWVAHYRTFWQDRLDAVARYVEQPADAGGEQESE